jgi:hypothetical protein
MRPRGLAKTIASAPGLSLGTTFEAKEVTEGLLLRITGLRPSLIGQDGFLVHTGRPTRVFDWLRLSGQARDSKSIPLPVLTSCLCLDHPSRGLLCGKGRFLAMHWRSSASQANIKAQVPAKIRGYYRLSSGEKAFLFRRR